MQESHIFSNLKTKLSDPSLSSKAWYRIANDITKLKNKNNPPPPQPQIHPCDKAQTLNEHFASISTVGIEPELPENTNIMTPPTTDLSLSLAV